MSVLVRLHGHTHVEARAGHRASVSTAFHLTALLRKPLLVTLSKLGGQEASGTLMSPLRSVGVTRAYLDFYVGCWGT